MAHKILRKKNEKSIKNEIGGVHLDQNILDQKI